LTEFAPKREKTEDGYMLSAQAVKTKKIMGNMTETEPPVKNLSLQSLSKDLACLSLDSSSTVARKINCKINEIWAQR